MEINRKLTFEEANFANLEIIYTKESIVPETIEIPEVFRGLLMEIKIFNDKKVGYFKSFGKKSDTYFSNWNGWLLKWEKIQFLPIQFQEIKPITFKRKDFYYKGILIQWELESSEAIDFRIEKQLSTIDTDTIAQLSKKYSIKIKNIENEFIVSLTKKIQKKTKEIIQWTSESFNYPIKFVKITDFSCINEIITYHCTNSFLIITILLNLKFSIGQGIIVNNLYCRIVKIIHDFSSTSIIYCQILSDIKLNISKNPISEIIETEPLKINSNQGKLTIEEYEYFHLIIQKYKFSY